MATMSKVVSRLCLSVSSFIRACLSSAEIFEKEPFSIVLRLFVFVIAPFLLRISYVEDVTRQRHHFISPSPSLVSRLLRLE